jgi:RIO-like serine/threonine protein kinase
LTAKIGGKILEAFKSIHSFGIIHGDVRAENILVAERGDIVWIIDFEFAEIMSEGDDLWESKAAQELEDVKELLKEVNNHDVSQ